jgi:hypothetical protein
MPFLIPLLWLGAGAGTAAGIGWFERTTATPTTVNKFEPGSTSTVQQSSGVSTGVLVGGVLVIAVAAYFFGKKA